MSMFIDYEGMGRVKVDETMLKSLYSNVARLKVGGIFDVVCLDGRFSVDDPRQPKWIESAKNVVTNEFMSAALNILFKASVATSTWYVGLMELTGAVTTADLINSHAGWKECRAYAGTTPAGASRQVWQAAGASNRQITNLANKAQFVMSGASTLYGALICSNPTSVLRPPCRLLCVASFSGSSRGVASGDTVQVTYQFLMLDDAV